MFPIKHLPHLDQMIDFGRDIVPESHFNPQDHTTPVIWGLIFFAVAILFAVLSWSITVGGQPSLIFQLLFLLFAGLGLIAVLASFVRPPV